MVTTQPVETKTVMIQIAKGKDGNWTIAPQDDAENKKRIAQLGKDARDAKDAIEAIQSRWKRRNPNPKKPLPGEDHAPIVFFEGEVLRFECEYEFGIGAKKNEDVDPVEGAPECPISVWSPDGRAVSGTVTRGAKDQAFYKFYGWVIVGGEKIQVDPDGYCGG